MKEIDLEGESTLTAISKADNFNFWMYQQMSPYLKGNVFEIGSGIGNISKYIQTDGEIVLSDLRDQYIKKLQNDFPDRQVIKLDLVHPKFVEVYADYIGKFDFVFALNVIEHIEQDKLAMRNMRSLLKDDGIFFILVPAYQFLFNNFDVALEHFKRYTKSSLLKSLPSDSKLIDSWYFNSLGILAWFTVGKLFSRKIIPESNMSLYNKIVPLVKLLDLLTFKKLGLSVIAVCRK